MEAGKAEVLDLIDKPIEKLSAFSRWPSLEEVPAVIDQATQLLVDEFNPLQVILFGSYARGDANEASDIDLLVVVPDEIEGTRSELNIRGGSRLWDMPMPIDLIVQRYSLVKKGQEIPESVLSTIKAQGKVLYERSGQTQSTLD
ncbi:MAG: nucleotidyltransferase domain-containing protein [Thermosynechococcaceae cyanobacterium]